MSHNPGRGIVRGMNFRRRSRGHDGALLDTPKVSFIISQESDTYSMQGPYPEGVRKLPAEDMGETPVFQTFLDLVYRKSPLQKKRILKFLESRGDSYRELAESFAVDYAKYLTEENITKEYAVDAYLQMCKDMMSEQAKFSRTGSYSCGSVPEAVENVYHNEETMKSYMHGLILSQFLWKNHYLMLKFFIEEVLRVDRIGRLLEIGSGHGLYIAQAMKRFPQAEFEIMDISPVSIAMTKKIVKHLISNPDKISFVQADARDCSGGGKFDFIIMGEVMEHVEDPLSLLVSVKKMLGDGGRLHITTCANCPAIDHVYCFDSVEAIVEMIDAAGFRVLKDIALPVEDIPREKWKETRVGINYAAALENGN